MQTPNKDLSALSDEQLLSRFIYEHKMLGIAHRDSIRFAEACNYHRKNHDFYKTEILKRMKKDARNEG